jgi:starch synthase
MVRALMDITFIRSHAQETPRRLGASLEAALHKHGHRVTLLLPLPSSADPASMSLARRLVKIVVDHGGATHSFDVFTGRDKAGVERVYLGGVRLDGHPDATGIFGAAAARYLLETDAVSDVVVGAGKAGAAALAALASSQEPAVRALLTEGEGLEGDALRAAEIVLTATDAERDAVLGRLGAELNGRPIRTLTPGLDPAEWNPLSDPHVASRFDPLDLRGKAKCKSALQRDLALPVRPEVPLIGVVGKGDEGGGVDLLARIGPDVLKNDVQLVVHVEGGGEVVGVLEEHWDRWPDRLQIRTGRDEEFIHRLVSASDAFFVPVESGDDVTLALAAQRYGALPIVSRKASVADAIVDVDPELQTGNGFAAGELNEPELLAVFRRVTAAFQRPEAFAALGQRAMRQDRTVESMIRLVEHLFESELEKKSALEADED